MPIICKSFMMQLWLNIRKTMHEERISSSTYSFKSSITHRFFLLFFPLYCIWEENQPLKWVRFINRSVPIASTLNDVRSSFWTWFPSPNSSKYAVECDWNSKISQNNQSLGFWKNRCFFFEKNLEIIQKC